jgi:hypothetical protein
MKYIHTLVLTAACTLFAQPAGAQMKPPAIETPAQFAQSVPGQWLVLAVRVTARERDTLRTELLARTDDSHYRTTGTAVELYFPADTPVVMGSGADVEAGAVLFVYAVATTRGRADAKRVTVITQYVSVQ